MKDLRFLELFNKTVHALESLCRNSLSEVDLSLGQPMILIWLNVNDKITQKELADKCGIDKTTLSRILDNMEKQGLVKRLPSEESRRSWAIHITKKGSQKAEETIECYFGIEKKLFQNFTQAEEEVFFSLFMKMYQNSLDPQKALQEEDTMNLKNFIKGKSFDAYRYFGAHKNNNGIIFRVYAPNALKISLIGQCNDWKEEEMLKDKKTGVFSLISEKASIGQMYKYIVYTMDGQAVYHNDPYGFEMELSPGCASYIVDLDHYQFADDNWMQTRSRCFDEPVNIYEMHMGSWKTKKNCENSWYSYSEIADELIAYVKEYGYSHIEIMPLNEHPVDCSWGYQSTGFYSPTSRYGTANQLKELIDKCHQADIGVIIDFVPVHFAVDSYALARFDGTALYESQYEDIEKSEWGSYYFDYSKGSVCSFLQSAANYWLKEYHFDGIRMDAISNIIYWNGNRKRGKNVCAIQFIQNMNDGLHILHPDIMLIAEDSTAYTGVTAPVKENGLGFDYKWDMGWMNDTLEYFKIPPQNRPEHYGKLTFSMAYFYDERFMLPFSHDEVVHGKATIIQKMWGQYEDKFSQCRALYAYMYAHPGKKLNFMGNELAQFREWDEKREQDWEILQHPMHQSFHKYMRDLNILYLTKPAMFEDEYDRSSYQWLEVNAPKESIYIFERGKAKNKIVAAFNFSDSDYEKFSIKVKDSMKIKELINSDYEIYGGKTPVKSNVIKATDEQGIYTIKINIPAFTGIIYEVVAN